MFNGGLVIPTSQEIAQMDHDPSAEGLLGQELIGFRILRMTEVFATDEDGRKSRSLGYFYSPEIATAFAGQQTDAPWQQTHEVTALINQSTGVAFLLGERIN